MIEQRARQRARSEGLGRRRARRNKFGEGSVDGDAAGSELRVTILPGLRRACPAAGRAVMVRQHDDFRQPTGSEGRVPEPAGARTATSRRQTREARDVGEELVRVTAELIEAGRSERGGWSKVQLALLGVSWPPLPGWKREVVGGSIPQADAERFVQLRGRSPPSGGPSLFFGECSR